MKALPKWPLSRPELAIAAGCVLVVCSAVLPGRAVIGRRQRRAMAVDDMRALLAAGRSFYDEYGVWPTAHSGEFGDYRYGRSLPNAEVVNVLRAQDGPGNPDHSVNPRRMVFLEVKPYRKNWSGLDGQGEFLDPWGQPYQLVLDTDLDNNCEMEYSIHGRRQGQGMAVWSCGPDRISDTADDLLSWQE